MGALGDRIGRRRFLLLGAAGFAVAPAMLIASCPGHDRHLSVSAGIPYGETIRPVVDGPLPQEATRPV